MKSNLLKLSIVFLIAGLLLSACGKGEPLEGEAATEAPAGKVSLLDVQADVSEFSSFVMESTFEIFDGKTKDLLYATTTKRSYRNNPLAERVIMEQTTAGEGAHGTAASKTLELVTLNGVTYSVGHTTGCMTMPADDAETSASLAFLDATTLLDSLQNAQQLHPNETINGVQTKHYHFDETVYAPQNQDGVDVEGHLYLATSDNHLVRLTIEGVDPQMAGEEGITADDHFRLEYNVLSVNQPVEITLPEECEEQAGNQGLASYPVLDDAYHILKQESTLTYKTKADINQVLAFYQKTLGKQGWSYNAQKTQEGEAGAIWFFERQQEELQVMAGGKSGQTVVSLTKDKLVKTDEPLAAEAQPLPHTPDAFDILSLSDTVIYRTHVATEDILAFYQEELAARGWEFDSEATLTNKTGTAWFFKREGTGATETIRTLIAPQGDDIVVTVQRVYE